MNIHTLGLLGYQIQHSLSPKIHSYWFLRYDIEAVYNLYDIAPGQEKEKLDHLFTSGICGLNITAPYKETVFQQYGMKDERLRAVNTLVRQKNAYYLLNTDVLGTMHIFKNISRFRDQREKIVILGNGGIARAVIEALYLLGVSKVHLVQRQQKNWPLAYQSMLSFSKWDEVKSIVAKATIVINTVPQLQIDDWVLAPLTLVCDYIYGNKPTPLIQRAQGSGLQFINGIEFLVRQAQHSFKAWFGIFPEITQDLKNILYQ